MKSSVWENNKNDCQNNVYALSTELYLTLRQVLIFYDRWAHLDHMTSSLPT